jgi:hypothetical protein
MYHYNYNSQGRIEHFFESVLVKQQVPEPEVVQEQEVVVVQEQEQVIIEPTVAKKIKCTYVKDKSEAARKCGSCCQDNNATWNKKYENRNNNTYCECNDMKMQTFNNIEYTYPADYFKNTGTNIEYFPNITNNNDCKTTCLNDETCSFSMFSKENMCYNGNQNPRKANIIKNDGMIITVKQIPVEIEPVFGAYYNPTSKALKQYDKKILYNNKASIPNCAQKCLNTPDCIFGTNNDYMNCILTSLPIQNADMLNDTQSVTFVP